MVEPAEGMPYIIVNKANQQGLYNAELSWDGGYGAHHARASVEFYDPVDWTFQRRGEGYVIRSMVDQQGLYNAELSWDGYLYHHAMSSVEFFDPVDWALQPSGPYFRIVNKANQQGLENAQLSWDGSTYHHAMASVEFNDPVDWAIVPSYSVSARWVSKQNVTASLGALAHTTTTWGTEQSASWSLLTTFKDGISATISAPAAEGGGVSGLTAEASQSVSSTIADAASTTHGETVEQSFPTGHLWQWEATVQNNHYSAAGARITALTRELALTESLGQEPRCAAGFCVRDTFCQQCHPNGELSR